MSFTVRSYWSLDYINCILDTQVLLENFHQFYLYEVSLSNHWAKKNTLSTDAELAAVSIKLVQTVISDNCVQLQD